jgi:hypothetical protein
MSVSLYYSATRPTPLTDVETAAVEGIVTAHMESFPYEYEETLYLYENGVGEPDAIVAGATKMPTDFDRVVPVLDHVLGSLTELRRSLPGAKWRVHLDDFDIPWDETDGYTLPE